MVAGGGSVQKRRTLSDRDYGVSAKEGGEHKSSRRRSAPVASYSSASMLTIYMILQSHGRNLRQYVAIYYAEIESNVRATNALVTLTDEPTWIITCSLRFHGDMVLACIETWQVQCPQSKNNRA